MTMAPTTARWLVLARFALMLVEMALVRAYLARSRRFAGTIAGPDCRDCG
jgi:hypothetical protein